MTDSDKLIKAHETKNKNKTAKEYYFGKRLPKRTKKNGTAARFHFVTVQSKTQPDKRLSRFLLHILGRECLLRL